MADKPLVSLQFPDLTDTYTIPQKTSDLTNDSGFVNAAGAAAAAPVQSVNGQTGAVTVQAATDAQVSTAVNTWCGNNVAQETGYALDSSLTMSNAAAPADKVGELKSAVENLEVIPYDVKAAMDTLFSKAAYADDDAASSYAIFHAWAMANPVTSITAVFTQGSATIFDTDSLDTLEQYLVVTATYSDSTTATVTDYTLSGTLTAGTSTITVSYGVKTATFNVTVTGWTWKYKASDGQTLTQRTDLFTVDTNNFAQTFTEEITDGYLRLFAENDGGKKLWKFASAYPQTNNNAVMEMRIKYTQVAYATEYSNLQIQLSDGTGGAKIGASRIDSKTGSPCFTTIIGTAITRAPTFELNSWHTIRIEIKNGLQSVYIDGESVVNNQQKCTSYCIYNRVFMQAPNIASTSTSSEVFIDYIAYKNYD